MVPALRAGAGRYPRRRLGAAGDPPRTADAVARRRGGLHGNRRQPLQGRGRRVAVLAHAGDVLRHAPGLRRPRRDRRHHGLRRHHADDDALCAERAARFAARDDGRDLHAARLRGVRPVGYVGLPRALGRAVPAGQRVGRGRCRVRAGDCGDARRAGSPTSPFCARRAAMRRRIRCRSSTACWTWCSRRGSISRSKRGCRPAIYLLEQTTVRASKQPAPLDVPLPQPKKRASADGRVRPARA